MNYPDHFDKLWDVMKSIHGKPSKRETYKKYDVRCREWVKDNNKQPEDFSEYIKDQIQAEKRYRQKLDKAGEFVAQWPMWSTYFNQYRYENEFVDKPHAELQDIIDNQKTEKCFFCQSEVFAYHSGKGMCTEHLRTLCPNPYKNELTEAWNRIRSELGAYNDEFYQKKYRPHLIRRGGLMNKLPYEKQDRID